MKKAKKIKVLVCRVGEAACVEEIENTLESMQALVGGYIEAIFPFIEPIALVCNEDSKCQDLPLNRPIHDGRTGRLLDIICGDFFLVGTPDDSDDFASLTEKQITKYESVFN